MAPANQCQQHPAVHITDHPCKWQVRKNNTLVPFVHRQLEKFALFLALVKANIKILSMFLVPVQYILYKFNKKNC